MFKILGVLLHENLCWKEHIKYVEIKIAKNIGLLYKAKSSKDKHLLLSLCHSCIHFYTDCGIIAWKSINRTSHKKTQ